MFIEKKTGSFADQIRCDEPSYLIWKWRPAGSQAGESRRANAIRWGSSLRVKEGEVAVFVYRQPNGIIEDFIEGPFDQTIKTANLPVLADMIGLAYDGGTPFQAEIYFINLARIVQVKFGVPYFDVYDPRFGDFGVPTAVRGTVNFHITDYREFIKLHRLTDFDLVTFQKQIRDAVSRYVKDVVANAPAAHDIPLVQIETKIAQINDAVEYDIVQRMEDSFGVTVTGVDLSAIELDKTSAGYRQLMEITKNVTAAKVQAETTDYIERMRIQREEGQYAVHKQTQTSNFAAYQVEAQTEIGVAGAEALGRMGENGAGGVDLGGSGTGFNPAAMMAGMAVGGAVGQNIAGAVNGITNGMQPPTQSMTPPPIPSAAYHVAVNGQATGPYNLDLLKQMASNGILTSDSLVWQHGMAEWKRAVEVQELKALFETVVPPPIPTE